MQQLMIDFPVLIATVPGDHCLRLGRHPACYATWLDDVANLSYLFLVAPPIPDKAIQRLFEDGARQSLIRDGITPAKVEYAPNGIRVIHSPLHQN